MRVLSRSKKAAPAMRLTLVSAGVDPELERMIRGAYATFARRRPRDVGRDHSLFEFETVDVLEISPGAAGVLVVVRYRGRGRTSRAPVDVPMAHVVDIRDGRVAR